jgi:hypothetical protein
MTLILSTAFSVFIGAIAFAILLAMAHDFPRKSKHVKTLEHIEEMELELGIVEPEQSMESMIDELYIKERLAEEARVKMRTSKVVIDDPPFVTDKDGNNWLNCHVEPINDLIEVEIDTEAYGYFDSRREFDRRSPQEVMNDIRKKNKTVPPMMIDHSIEQEWPGNLDFSRRRPRA